jgi:hypothetical protein
MIFSMTDHHDGDRAMRTDVVGHTVGATGVELQLLISGMIHALRPTRS